MKNKILLTGLALLVAISLVAAGCAAPSPAEKEKAPSAPATIKIGIVTDITGPISAMGQAFLWGVRKDVETVNEDGGIYIKEFDKKIPIELIEADHAADINKAIVQAEYVNTQGVVAVIGTTSFLPGGAAATEKYGLPCLLELSYNKKPFELGYKYMFTKWPRTDDFGKTFIAFLNSLPEDQRPTTIAIFEGIEEIGVEMATYCEQEALANGYKAKRIKFEMLAQDLSAQILEAKKIGADAVYGLMLTPTALLMVKQMQELDYNPKVALIDMGSTNPDVWMNVLGKAGNYIYCFLQFVKGMEWPGANEFVAAFEAANPGQHYYDPAASGYSGMQIVVDAITRAGSLDREKIRDALATTDMVTIVGPVKFRANGTMEREYATIVQYQDGVQTIVFPPELKQKPAIPMPTWKER